MNDIVIHDGLVVDGTGRPGRVADVAVNDGRVTAIGTHIGAGRRTIDAAGLVVSPGFVDIHTHYDAQLGWDPFATPSPLHGVTTVIGGNCGFTIAPLSPTDDGYLLRMLARVEGMPVDALAAGLDWSWQSFAEWLDRLDGRLAVNAGFLVGHSAIRRSVMGDAAVGNPATDDQVADMVRLLHEALGAGGLGFSTSRAGSHSDGEGRPVPSRHAAVEELYALCAATGEHAGTQLEAIVSNDLFSDADVDLMATMSRLANRPLNWNVLRVERDPARAEHQLRASDLAAERGGRVVALAAGEPSGFRTDLATGLLFGMFPGWAPVMTLPVAERREALSNPETRHGLKAALTSLDPTTRLAALARFDDLVVAELNGRAAPQLVGRSLGEIARDRGCAPVDVLFDLMLESSFSGSLQQPTEFADELGWKHRAELWNDRRTVIGASDAGAHLDTMCGATYTTTVVGPAVRDHQVVSLERAVELLTSEPAALYGLRDKGVLREGAAADVVVFDPTRVGPRPLETRRDLPGGAARLYAEADGIEHVLVNGVEIAASGTLTGALPGTLLRSGRDTTTVTAH